ncbi:MAG: hypothetical protein ACR2ON_07650 [Paracoccaceae bacterium]
MSKLYEVKINVTEHHTTWVEADNEDEAMEEAIYLPFLRHESDKISHEAISAKEVNDD